MQLLNETGLSKEKDQLLLESNKPKGFLVKKLGLEIVNRVGI